MKQDSTTVGSNSRLRRDALVYASLFIAYLTIDSVHDGKKVCTSGIFSPECHGSRVSFTFVNWHFATLA
jgi:hypothetical protein